MLIFSILCWVSANVCVIDLEEKQVQQLRIGSEDYIGGSLCYFSFIQSSLVMMIRLIVEFHAREVQSFPLLQRWSIIWCNDGYIQTLAVEENARQGKTVVLVARKFLPLSSSRWLNDKDQWSKQQWCGLGPSVLGQNRSETKKLVLVLQAVVLVLVLQFWCCFVKHDLVTLVVIMILKDTATFKILFIYYLLCKIVLEVQHKEIKKK